MSSKLTKGLTIVVILCGVVLLAGRVSSAMQLPMPVEAQADPAPDLQKQIDDALKELDKLEKIIPDQADGAKKQLDDLRQQMKRFPQGGNGGLIIGPGVGGLGVRNVMIGQGRWGVSLQPPPAVLVDQLQLPPGQGLVVMEVRPDSPAAKAGIAKHDVLIEVEGKPASSDFATFQRDTRDIKAGVEVPVSVIRHGKRESIKGLKLPEARADALAPAGLPPLAGIAGNPFGNARVEVNVGDNEIIKSQVNNDDFTVNYVSGEVRAKVFGKRENGKATPAEITIQDGETRISVRTMDQVPERYRATITRMVETIR